MTFFILLLTFFFVMPALIALEALVILSGTTTEIMEVSVISEAQDQQ